MRFRHPICFASGLGAARFGMTTRPSGAAEVSPYPAMMDRGKRGLRLLVLVLLFAAIHAATAAPGITGLWLTQDHDGIIKINNCGGNLCAEMAGLILDHPNDPAPVDYRGVSQCHLPLISDAHPIQPNLWKGHITDPRNGSVYGVELRLDPRGNLALRGFLGIPLLGHTQTWTRYAGKVPDDCRMYAGSPVAGTPAGRS
jgi:uncharacterized protein (DUF2147 family)